MSELSIDKPTLIAWLGDGTELAVLDIRSPEEVGYATPLFATMCRPPTAWSRISIALFRGTSCGPSSLG